MEVKTPKEFFEKVLPTKFNPDKAKDFEAVFQVDITGTNGGHWIITIRNETRARKFRVRLQVCCAIVQQVCNSCDLGRQILVTRTSQF
jgi:hypothetical protein